MLLCLYFDKIWSSNSMSQVHEKVIVINNKEVKKKKEREKPGGGERGAGDRGMSGKVILITWEGYRSPHCSSLIVFMPGSLLLSPFLVFCISLLCLKELCSQPVPLNKSSVLSTGSTIEPERVSALDSYFSITIET